MKQAAVVSIKLLTLKPCDSAATPAPVSFRALLPNEPEYFGPEVGNQVRN